MKSLENYVTVNERIMAFFAKYPDGSLQAEFHFPDENTVRCRAFAYRIPDDARPGIGHAEERRDQGMVNKTSAVENAESSAWGRALAALGFEVQRGVASREEVEIAQRKAKAQADTPKAVTGQQDAPERFVDYLRRAIQVYASEELKDERIWQNMVAAASTKEKNAQLVKALNAQLVEVGGNPDAVKEMWQKHQAAKA